MCEVKQWDEWPCHYVPTESPITLKSRGSKAPSVGDAWNCSNPRATVLWVWHVRQWYVGSWDVPSGRCPFLPPRPVIFESFICKSSTGNQLGRWIISNQWGEISFLFFLIRTAPPSTDAQPLSLIRTAPPSTDAQRLSHKNSSTRGMAWGETHSGLSHKWLVCNRQIRELCVCGCQSD